MASIVSDTVSIRMNSLWTVTNRHQLTTKNFIPEGWTTDPREMSYDAFWRSHDSPGQQIAREHGLKDTQPIMCTKRETKILSCFNRKNAFISGTVSVGISAGYLSRRIWMRFLWLWGEGGLMLWRRGIWSRWWLSERLLADYREI